MKKYEAKISGVAPINLDCLGFEGYDDNIKVYTFHKGYRIGNEHSYSNLQECIEANKEGNYIFRLYMQDHSRWAFSLAPFSDKRDSGLLGCLCIRRTMSSLDATRTACQMVQEANDIEAGAYVELQIKELDICDCCGNIKTWKYVEKYLFNIHSEVDKLFFSLVASSYIKGFDVKALDKLIENRYKNFGEEK